MKTETEKLYFQIDGKWLTGMVRNVWDSNLPKNAFTIIKDGIQGDFDNETILKIILGELTFNGINQFELVHDNSGIKPYFDLDKQYKILFNNFRNSLSTIISFHKECMLKYGYNNDFTVFPERGYVDNPHLPYLLSNEQFSNYWSNIKISSKIDKKRYLNLIEKYKKDLEQFEFVSKLCNKSLLDFPFELLGASLTDKELEEIEKQYAFEVERQSIEKQKKAEIKIDEVKIEVKPVEIKPTRLDNIRSIHGWLCPHGDFYEVGFQEHDAFAGEMQRQKMIPENVFIPKSYLEKNGWFELTSGEWLITVDTKLTQKQIDFISDYAILYSDEKVKCYDEVYKIKEFLNYITERQLIK